MESESKPEYPGIKEDVYGSSVRSGPEYQVQFGLQEDDLSRTMRRQRVKRTITIPE